MKKPCKSCPFSRENDLEKPNPGGSPPEVYLGQTRGPFFLPCHKGKNYDGKNTNLDEALDCAGAKIFRANCKVPYRLPENLVDLPEDHELVFSNEKEFYDFWYERDSGNEITQAKLDEYLIKELSDVNVRPVNRKN